MFGRPPVPRRGGPNVFLLMGVVSLLQQLFALSQRNALPIVTVALMGLNSLVYVGQTRGTVPPISQICLNANAIRAAVRYGDFGTVFRRLIFPAFYHGDDMHIYYNMASLFYKGIQLENGLLGPRRFAGLCLFSTVMSHVLVVVVSLLLQDFGYAKFATECAVGFSAGACGFKDRRCMLGSMPLSVIS